MTRSKIIVVLTVVGMALITSVAPGVAEPETSAPVYLALGDS